MQNRKGSLENPVWHLNDTSALARSIHPIGRRMHDAVFCFFFTPRAMDQGSTSAFFPHFTGRVSNLQAQLAPHQNAADSIFSAVSRCT